MWLVVGTLHTLNGGNKNVQSLVVPATGGLRQDDRQV